jgi:hypothetical protein
VEELKSESTTKGRVCLVGLFEQQPAKKLMISRKNQQARVKFVLEYRNWTIKQCSRLLWSDKSKYNLFGSD